MSETIKTITLLSELDNLFLPYGARVTFGSAEYERVAGGGGAFGLGKYNKLPELENLEDDFGNLPQEGQTLETINDGGLIKRRWTGDPTQALGNIIEQWTSATLPNTPNEGDSYIFDKDLAANAWSTAAPNGGLAKWRDDINDWVVTVGADGQTVFNVALNIEQEFQAGLWDDTGKTVPADVATIAAFVKPMTTLLAAGNNYVADIAPALDLDGGAAFIETQGQVIAVGNELDKKDNGLYRWDLVSGSLERIGFVNTVKYAARASDVLAGDEFGRKTLVFAGDSTGTGEFTVGTDDIHVLEPKVATTFTAGRGHKLAGTVLEHDDDVTTAPLEANQLTTDLAALTLTTPADGYRALINAPDPDAGKVATYTAGLPDVMQPPNGARVPIANIWYWLDGTIWRPDNHFLEEDIGWVRNGIDITPNADLTVELVGGTFARFNPTTNEQERFIIPPQAVMVFDRMTRDGVIAVGDVGVTDPDIDAINDAGDNINTRSDNDYGTYRFFINPQTGHIVMLYPQYNHTSPSQWTRDYIRRELNPEIPAALAAYEPVKAFGAAADTVDLQNANDAVFIPYSKFGELVFSGGSSAQVDVELLAPTGNLTLDDSNSENIIIDATAGTFNYTVTQKTRFNITVVNGSANIIGKAAPTPMFSNDHFTFMSVDGTLYY